MCKISSKNTFFVLIWFFCCVFINEEFFVSAKVPCNFIDSVNISGGILQFDKSILFDGMIFPVDQYAEVNYILRNGKTPINVKPHIRGCPCSFKACIRLCCPFGSFATNYTSNAEFLCSKNETAKTIKRKIFHENNNQSEILDLSKHFSFVDRACKRYYFAHDFQITNVKIGEKNRN